LRLEKIAIEKLNPAQYNPRKDLRPGDPEYEKLKKSMETFGYVEPIVWNKQTGNIVSGHQRLKVLRHQGEADIECVVVDLDGQQEKALNITLNKVSGEWDLPKLADLISELDDGMFDISITGFDAAEIEHLFSQIHDKDIKEDDFDVDGALKEPVISKPGDLWLLGRHRLLCGDSTKAETYEILMGGKQANLVVTDPPYNVNFTAGSKKERLIKNDHQLDGDFYQFLLAAFKNIYRHLADGGALYVFHADTEGLNFRNAVREVGFHLSGVCVWVKDSLVLGRSDYQWQHEPIIYAWKPTGRHRWYADRKQTTVWQFDRPKRSAEHPTMKPVALCGYPIRNSSAPNGIVLDPFGGSGSTLIACEQLDRTCYMAELDEKYVDVIVKRYIEQVGSDDEVYLLRAGEKISHKDAL